MKIFGKKVHTHTWIKDEALYLQAFNSIIVNHNPKAKLIQECSGCEETRIISASLGFNIV